ncbi:hypothetical protein [Oceanobacillus sp. Castelsardo]|uniref:hypothetical protein n=1 Tax=Oceanobacillus sp. Castelsardo TaxID=1851204 RepID=UPI00083826D5|nr:hypothetical protein [Oceanobacillus sp. Castelsardo]
MARYNIDNPLSDAGRNKLNAMFEELYKEYTGAGINAKEAREKAVQAVADSLLAKDIAETTRQELINIIREQTAGGDVVPEVVRARGKHQDLGDRLNSTDLQMAQTTLVVNPNNLKEPTDIDDTESFRRMISKSIEKGIRKLVVPYGEYTISKQIWLNGASDFEIDLQNSKIIWNGQETVTTNRGIMHYGVFTAMSEGYDTEVTQKSVIAWEQELSLPTHIVPEENHDGWTMKCSKLTLADVTGLSEGDFIHFAVGQANASGNEDYWLVFKPTVNVVCKILHIIGNDVYVDYHNPYDFSQVDIPSVSWVKKIKTINNVTIKNAYIEDVSPYEAPKGITGDNPNRDKLVSGIGFHFAVNCKAENIRGKGLKLPLVMIQSSYKTDVEKIELEKPESHGGGEGYAVHYDGSIKCTAKDIEGNDGNSILDFSASAFCLGERVRSSVTYSHKTIGTHSMAEHDITFRDCEGVFGFSNSSLWFASMSVKIVLDNCKGSIVSAGDSYTDILINGGEYKFHDNTRTVFKNAVFNKSKVFLGIQTEFSGHGRGIDTPSSITFDECDIVGVNYFNGGLLTRTKFSALDTLKIGGSIDFTDVDGRLRFEDVKEIGLYAKLKNVPISVQQRNNVVNLVNLIFEPKQVVIDDDIHGSSLFELDEIQDVTLLMNVVNSNFTYLRDSDFYLYAFNASVNKSNTTIVLNTVGNTFYSAYNNKLRVHNEDAIDTNTSYKKIQKASSNITVGAWLTGSWDVALNRDINKDNVNAAGFMNLSGNPGGSVLPQRPGILANVLGTKRVFLSFDNSSNQDWFELARIQYGSSSQRPTSRQVGTTYFDTDLAKPIFWGGDIWRDANGQSV